MTVDAHPSAPPTQQPPCRAKVRIRFRKSGALRLISHHDLMHCFERMLRRAALRIHTTQGFHPKPRMVFAQSLALGIIGCCEVVELELDEPLAAEDIHRLLTENAPPGIDILETRSIDPRAKATVRRAGYRVALPAEVFETLPKAIGELLASPECWIERTRPQPRRLDIRPYIDDVQTADHVLVMRIWISPNGTARPEEIVSALGMGKLLDQGLIFERDLLELEDEMTAAELARIPNLPAPRSQLSRQGAENGSDSKPTALMAGPLAFDS